MVAWRELRPFRETSVHAESEWCYAVRRSTEELGRRSSRESAWPGKGSAAKECVSGRLAIYHDSAWTHGCAGAMAESAVLLKAKPWSGPNRSVRPAVPYDLSSALLTVL